MCDTHQQGEVYERVGHHDSAGSSSGQSAALRPGRRLPHRKHLQCHKNRYVCNLITLCQIKRKKKKICLYLYVILYFPFPCGFLSCRKRELLWEDRLSLWEKSDLCGDRWRPRWGICSKTGKTQFLPFFSFLNYFISDWMICSILWFLTHFNGTIRLCFCVDRQNFRFWFLLSFFFLITRSCTRKKKQGMVY